MRDTIDFGIDLGTTNSAIAVSNHGEISVVKNNDGWDYTPSAVWLPNADRVLVGRQARERILNKGDTDNTQAEFKQEMGLNDTGHRFVKAGVTLTPQQLSAEVLKSLRGDAAHQFGEQPEAAVITVPAAFRLHQTNATNEAAALAGLGTSCPLVQEPTAAAFAYGFHERETDAYWMIFDFGGGTFDAALVNTYEGELRVIDHAGDPHLGGKLIDWAIVERLLAPAVVRDLGFSGFTRDNPQWRKNFGILKGAAENAKIGLSRSEAAEITVELSTADGEDETFEFTLRRGEVDNLAEPFYNRAINLCRDALRKANLGASDIDRLALVGGATLAPGLRELLADPKAGLGIELDHSQDPTTVVARGAAVFAGTVPLERQLAAPKLGEFTADLEYPRSTSLTEVLVSGRFHSGSEVDWTGYKVVLDNPNGRPPFRSPQIALDPGGTFSTEVVLDASAASTFSLILTDAGGSTQKATPETITIKQTVNELGGQVLTNSIGISLADRSFAAMADKGATLPITTRETFVTTVELRRSDTDAVIKIPIVEGERERADRNLAVGLIEIRPKDLRMNLPRGSDVEMTVEINESRILTVTADVPLVEEQFEAEINLSEVPPPPLPQLQRSLDEVEQRLEQLRESAEHADSADARIRLGKLEAEGTLEYVHGEVRSARTDKGSAAAADLRLRELQAELDEVEADVRLPALLSDLDSAIEYCRELVSRLGDADDRAELASLERRAEQARREKDSAAVDELLDRASALQAVLRRRDGTLDLGIFYYFKEHRDELTSPGRAQSLLEEGDRAIATGDLRALPGINQRLRPLLPSNLPDPSDGGITHRDRMGRR